MATQFHSLKKYYSLKAGATMKANKNLEMHQSQQSDQDFEHDDGSVVGIGLIGAILVALVIAVLCQLAHGIN
jgi:hypothetical protein